MRIVVSTKGRFHAFNLARELHRHGNLERLITSLPSSRAAKFGIPPKHVIALLATEVLDQAWRRIPQSVRVRFDPQILLCELFDMQAAKHIFGEIDVFVGWSSFSLRCLRAAKAIGAKTVLERGSSHILSQRDILADEYARAGTRAALPHPKVVEKELAEYELADHIAIPSTFVRRTFLEHGVSESKLLQVPYGVDLEQFRPISKGDSIFRVIHCGALSVRKGVHYLLQAFHELRLPGSELWLIGHIADEIRPFLAQFGGTNVICKGSFPQNELYKYYSQGSAFCLASVEEGMAMVQAQAMACGLPLICTTNTGGEDLVREGVEGFVVPIRSVAALKEKIRYLYENPKRRAEMGESGRVRACREYSWEQYGNRIIAAYMHILGVRRSA